jgi:uncharacterized damage-inducible protein DinB
MKHFDLKPVKDMDFTIGLLHATVKDTYERLKMMCQDMNQEEIEYKGPNNRFNSTAQLLRHLAVVDLYWVYRIKQKEVPFELKEKYGPMIHKNGNLPEVQGVTLNELLLNYDLVQEMFEEACKGLSDKDLEKEVEYEKGTSATIRWGIWHIADHNRYHQANISWLKIMRRMNL